MPRSYATTVPRVLMHNANTFGGGQFRVLQPASLLRQHGYALVQAHPQLLDSAVLDILAPDAVVVQFQQTDEQIEAMRRYRKALPNAFFVYEIDDLFWQVPDASLHKGAVAPDAKERIKTAAMICDAITVTTEPLAREMRRLTGMKDVRVVPNEVPMQFVNAALAGRRTTIPTSTKPRVGWAGGIGHTGDLAIITEVMKILGDEVHWVFMGLVPPGIDPATIEFHQGVPFENYAAGLGALNLDVALAPLEDNNFNRCKSDLRILEYGAAGFPVIASNIITYRDCPYLMRCSHMAEDWAEAIRTMVRSRADRESMAEALHTWVVEHRCMDKNLATRIKAFLPRNTVCFDPSTAVPAPFPGPVVTVGANLPGLADYPTIEAAWAAAPGSNILYLRPNAAVNPLQFARMLDALQSGCASVSALTNDSLYPTPNQFVPIDAATAENLDMAAMLLNDEPVRLPCPSGPCVLLSASALYRYGLPTPKDPRDVELAFMDWGARAAEGGRVHVVVANVYIHAGTRIDRTRETVERAARATVGWVPSMGQNLQAFVQNDPLAKVRENLELAFHRFHYETPRAEASYESWIKVYDTIGAADIDAMQKTAVDWKNPPHINIVLPTFNTPVRFLNEAIASVLGQVYPNWSLLIVDDCSTDPRVVDEIEKWSNTDPRISVTYRPVNGHICEASNTALEMANPGWVLFLDHDDTLAPHALWMIAREIVGNEDLVFIYSDADKIKEDGARDHPYFAPDFNYELLLASNYVTHLAAYRVDGVREIGGFRPGFEGSQDWDLVLRYLTAYCGTPPDRRLVRHIPHILYHWRMSPTSTAANIEAKPYALEAGRRAVTEHLRSIGEAAFVGPNPQAPICTLVRFMPPDPTPLVSIIIPTRDNDKVLARCLGTLVQRTAYPNIEIIVVDNGSKEPATLRLLNDIQKDKRIRVFRRPGPFNYSRLNNDAVKEAAGDLVCLLNDDTEIVEGAWLNDLVGLALRKGVGAVGPKLLYPNGAVQQNGIFIDWTARPGGRAVHAWQQLPAGHPGQANRNLITQEYAALTGACMVIRKALYLEIGGLDEEAFPVDYNDVDFCLRLYDKGYRNIVCAQAVMFHHEGQTKKKHVKEHAFARVVADEERLVQRHWHIFDGQWNRNLLFHPHLDQVTSASQNKPWTFLRQRVLIINGTIDDAMQAWKDGDLPFCATLHGHALHMTYPQMSHVRPIDLRGSVEPFLEILGVLDIPRLVFCGIGNGTIGAVGFFAAVTDLGWPVEYRPTNTAEFRDPYIASEAWEVVFSRLREAQANTAAGVANGRAGLVEASA